MKKVVNNPKLMAKATFVSALIASIFLIIRVLYNSHYVGEPIISRVGFSIVNMIYASYISIIYYFYRINYSKKIKLKSLDMFIFISSVITLLLIILSERMWTSWNLIYMLIPIYLGFIFYVSSKSKLITTISFIICLLAFIFCFINSLMNNISFAIINILSQIHILPLIIYMWLYGKSKYEMRVNNGK